MPACSLDDLAPSCCQDPDSTLYGRRHAGDLSVRGRLGKPKQFRQLYCHGGRGRVSEPKGPPPDRGHPPEETAASVLEHRAEGDGLRPTGRPVGVHRDTVARRARVAGEPAQRAHEELVAFPPGRARSSPRRSGPSSPRSGRTAIHSARPMTPRGTGGTTSPLIPSIG